MRARPGPRNLITDVPGIRVGHAGHATLPTGVTVLIPDWPMTASVDVRGGAPGARETDLLDPAARVDRIDGLTLSGGSAFGLDAAAGLMGWLVPRGRGVTVNGAVVPIVPGAILFDLRDGIERRWGAEPPYRALAAAAADAADVDFALGNQGAGLGAKAGRLKGGLGSASAIADGIAVGALVAANPRGSVTMPGSGCFWAWALERDGEFGAHPPPTVPLADLGDESEWAPPVAGANTTIAAVAVDARLTKMDCRRLAIMAQDGLARAIRPVHAPFDGDIVFALATGRGEPVDTNRLNTLGSLAADCLARAIARAVYEAEATPQYPSWRARHGRQGGSA